MKPRAVVIGAGILGLAHATHFARRGWSVTVLERGAAAVGASVRNFGMVWPIGQPPGEPRRTALRSREIWLEVLAGAGIWHRRSGSMHLAYADDEWAVLGEFEAQAAEHGYACERIDPSAVLAKSPHVRPEGLRGALYSPEEVCVMPREVVAELPAYLATLGVAFRFGTAAVRVEPGLVTTGVDTIPADAVVLCTGDDFETLFPEHYRALGLVRTKLQMLRARPRQPDFEIGTHLCAGLTLGHYRNFEICPSLGDLKERFAREMPEHVRWGVHLLVSQHGDGALTIGDSHEYGDVVTPFLREEIDRLILSYLDTFLPLERLEVFERWHGVYAKHPSAAYLIDEVAEGVYATTGVGGAGMTLSFGVAEKAVEAVEEKLGAGVG